MSSSPDRAPLTPVVVPDLGTRSQPVQLVQWLIDPGTFVHAGDRIAELLVAGVVFHLPAPVNGVLTTIRIRAHSPVCVGDLLAWIDAMDSAP